MKKTYAILLASTLSIFSFVGILPTTIASSSTLNIDGKFVLIPLPYSYDALEPYIDKRTMEIHHDKHEQAYVDNLNKALINYPELYSKTTEEMLKNLDTIPDDIKQKVINNAGGVYNHEFFWSIMSPKHNQKPSGELLKAIDSTFGSFDNFKKLFAENALSRFGSGCAWLVKDSNNKLSIITTANQDSPISNNLTPIIGLDVWEHAYYLKYQNKRNEYIDNWWNVVNWEQAEKNYSK
nr:superoxide dismutase [Clostridium sp.]